MNLKLLQAHIQEFQQLLETNTDFPLLFAWESQRIFQGNWDVDAEDFGAMYDASLQNSSSRRLWKGLRYAPKEQMQLFIATYPDFVRDMFKDLFNENKAVENRIDRFVFHCDELLREYRSTHPDWNETRHYHEDYQMISLYLAFRYPDQYALFDDRSFRRFLEKTGAKDIPKVADPGRFFKVARTVYTLIAKEEACLAAHYKRLDPDKHFMGKSLLLSLECMQQA